VNANKATTSRFALVLACSLLLFACSTQHPSSQELSATNPKPVSLRLKWVYDPGFAGEMVAAKAGFFKEAGLDVSLKPGGFEADPVKLVASGSDTFGVAGADSFLLARAKGVPIVAFAAGYLQTPVVFYVHGDSKILAPKDFAGRRVGYQAGQDTATVYEAMIKKTGVDRSKIKEVPIKFDFTPFLTGQVDVWPGYAATQSYILEREHKPYRVIEPGSYGIAYLGTVYFAKADFVASHPEIIQAFVKGLIRGWEYAYANTAAAIPLISAYDSTNLTADLVRFNLDKQKSSILPDASSRFCRYTDSQWQSLQQVLVAQNLLQGPSPAGAYTMTFLDKAYGTGK
jgi:NitT/TauT family transport system substrate-binding protein